MVFSLSLAACLHVSGQAAGSGGAYKAAMGADELVLGNPEGKSLLSYRHALKHPPAGVDPAYARSGYVHPLQTLAGKVLTNIQPADHYHHYGLWNPWTRVECRGKVYDLWNLGDKQGTVRFAGFQDLFGGPKDAGFDAVHDHVVFDGEKETAIIREHFCIRVSQLDKVRYRLDLHSVLRPVAEDLTLKEYRYAGLGLRFTPEWTVANSRVLTSSGKNRKEADGSRERWTIVSGKLGGEDGIGEGGVLFLSHPANYNFPEPIRVWPEDANGGRGDQFFNFSPTKNMDWFLKAGETYTLRYRLVVFDGELSPEEAEGHWREFSEEAFADAQSSKSIDKP